MPSEKEVVMLLKELYRCRDGLDAVCKVVEEARWSKRLAKAIVSDLLNIAMRLKAVANTIIEEYGLLEEKGGCRRRRSGKCPPQH